jgi:hypothetical protein
VSGHDAPAVRFPCGRVLGDREPAAALTPSTAVESTPEERLKRTQHGMAEYAALKRSILTLNAGLVVAGEHAPCVCVCVCVGEQRRDGNTRALSQRAGGRRRVHAPAVGVEGGRLHMHARASSTVIQRGGGVLVRPGGAVTTATLGLAYGQAFLTGGVVGLVYMRLLANQVGAPCSFMCVRDIAVERKRADRHPSLQTQVDSMAPTDASPTNPLGSLLTAPARFALVSITQTRVHACTWVARTFTRCCCVRATGGTARHRSASPDAERRHAPAYRWREWGTWPCRTLRLQC